MASPASEAPPEPGEQFAEEYPDQPPLDDERKPYKMIAAGVAALVGTAKRGVPAGANIPNHCRA